MEKNNEFISRFIKKMSAHLQESHSQRINLEVRLEMSNEVIANLQAALEQAEQRIAVLETPPTEEPMPSEGAPKKKA